MFETALQHEAEQRTHQLLSSAGHHFGRDPGRVVVKFDLSGKAAGMALLALFPHRASPIIRYNALLLAENRENFLRRTVPHEVAHVVVRRMFGKRTKPHGPEWRRVMALFEADPSRCHDYDISRASRRRLKRFDYRCNCRSHQLTSIRHNRVLQGQVYLCLKCRQPLAPC